MMVRALMCLIAIVWGNVDRIRTFLPVFWFDEFNQMLLLWPHAALWSMLILVFGVHSNAPTLASYGLVEHVDFGALVFIQMLQLWLHTALWSLMFIKQCTQMLVTGHVKAERIRLRGIVQLHYDAILTINCMHLSFLHRHGPWP